MVVLICLMLLSSVQTVTAQGNLIVNGGFDTSSNGIAPDGWTLTAGYWNIKNGDPLPDVVLSGGGTASQTIYSLTPGTLYTVSGDYGCSGTDTTNTSFEVLLGGVPLFGTAVPTNSSWNSFSFEYTASSSSVVLTMWQITGGNYSVGDYSIDNISMYAVPEPTTFALLGLVGVLFVTGHFRRARVAKQN